MHTNLIQRRLRWFGHVLRKSNEGIPKSLLYSEFAVGKRNVGRPRLRHKDVCKRDLKSLDIDIHEWENITTITIIGTLLSGRNCVKAKELRGRRNQN